MDGLDYAQNCDAVATPPGRPLPSVLPHRLTAIPKPAALPAQFPLEARQRPPLGFLARGWLQAEEKAPQVVEGEAADARVVNRLARTLQARR